MPVAETSTPPVPLDEAGPRVAPEPAAEPPDERHDGTSAGVLRLVSTLLAVGVLGTAAVGLALPAPWPGWGRFVLLVGLVSLSLTDGAHLYRGGGRVRITFSFSEIGVLLALVYLSGVVMVLALATSAMIYELVTRRGLAKAIYNVAQCTLGGCVAVLVLTVLPPLGAAVDGVSLVSASVGVLGYALVGIVTWYLLLRRLVGSGAWQELLPTFGVDATAALGATSVAVMVLALWNHDRVLLTYLLVPLVATLLVYRLVHMSQELIRQRTADAEALRRLVTSASDGILMVDGGGVVVVWNPVLESLTGVAADTAEGTPLDQVMTGVARVADAPVGHEATTVATWRDGRVLEERSASVDGGHAAAGRVIVLRDITRQREADALKSDFVARVSHELRTPLTPLTGFIELLRTQPDRFDPRTHTAALDAMTRNTERMAALVDELLMVVEIDDGSLRADRGPVDVGVAVRTAHDRLRIDASGHEFVLGLPEGTVAMGDVARLPHVLEHLLDNAVRYSPAGTRVEVTAAEEDGAVRVWVRDHGAGIPSTAHDLVFERFSRLEGPLRMRTSGLGLGLFVARRLTEAMGGALEIVSSDDRGTTMELRLPALACPV